MAENTEKRALSGITPSGTLHLGNYFGMMKPAIEMQYEYECFYFIADYHALTQLPEREDLQQRAFRIAVDFLACGLDPARTTFFRQSDVPEVLELTWMLNCLTPVGLLERCHSYKDKVEKGLPANHGLLTYPVLMSSDILIYQSNVVPVGKDQKQHLEITRDLATRFNHQYGEILTMPEARIRESVAAVPGIDGRKMSKSYDNTIELFDSEKQMRKRIMEIVTDSTPLDEPKDPETCNVFALYKLFASEEEVEQMREQYMAGGFGYGHAKKALFEKCREYFRPFREKHEYYLNHPQAVEDILQDGARHARAVARQTVDEVRKAVGID